MPQPLEVSPSELHATADSIDSHGADFASTHRRTLHGVGQVSLGTGPASAALPQLLAAWETDGAHFGEHFTKHAAGHRAAADAYLHTDNTSAERVNTTNPTL